MSIPKTIWALWCNFKDKKDGILDEKITYFKDRIIKQHSEWEINIITSWDQCINYIKDNEILMNLINNDFIGAAHKSDAIRYFLINKFGGFWLDISTFLFTPLDIYYTLQPNSTFIGYYTPPFMIEEIIYSSFGDMFDSIKFSKIVNKMKNEQNKFIDLNDEYKNYPFMPENFFFASIPNHPITYDILQQLLIFWETSLPKISDNISLCYEINKLMNTLSSEIFNINNIDYNIYKTFTNNNITNKSFSQKILNNIWHCGYVFNYLQMYKSIVKYIKESSSTIIQEDNPNELTNNYNKDLCTIEKGNINTCKNIIIKNKNNNSVLYLISLSYNRLIKWTDKMEERVSFDNTYITELIDTVGPTFTKEQLIEKIISMGIYQIKFSNWTRGSKIIPKFMTLYPNTINGGNKNSKLFSIGSVNKRNKSRNKTTNKKKFSLFKIFKRKTTKTKIKNKN